MIKLGRVIKNQEAIKTAKGRDEIFEGKIHEDPLINRSNGRGPPAQITKFHPNAR